jgi:hypothetical protein
MERRWQVGVHAGECPSIRILEAADERVARVRATELATVLSVPVRGSRAAGSQVRRRRFDEWAADELAWKEDVL